MDLSNKGQCQFQRESLGRDPVICVAEHLANRFVARYGTTQSSCRTNRGYDLKEARAVSFRKKGQGISRWLASSRPLWLCGPRLQERHQLAHHSAQMRREATTRADPPRTLEASLGFRLSAKSDDCAVRIPFSLAAGSPNSAERSLLVKSWCSGRRTNTSSYQSARFMRSSQAVSIPSKICAQLNFQIIPVRKPR